MGKAHKVSTLHKELQATEENRSDGNGLLQERAHLIVHCQMVSPESMRISNIKWAERVIFRKMYVLYNAYMHAIAISEERHHEFEEESGGMWKDVWREEREDRIAVIYNLKIFFKNGRKGDIFTPFSPFSTFLNLMSIYVFLYLVFWHRVLLML